VVAVDFGYTDVPVEAFRPDRVIGSFAQLPDIIDDLARVKNAMDDQGFIGHKA
jgi:phosphoglycolate phosphatase